ncbi:multiprotein-bridging factor 1 family protein [Nocardia sp. NPDC057227]|uniref:helix-turn-helix domain-containing protein n=1 Tax=Nocardia sp. NPDC057227 TaxID=3346056 RepID=UPI003641EB54
MNTGRTARILKQLRTGNGWSLRELAAKLYCDHSLLSRVESGDRWPKDRGWVEQADIVLAGKGQLVAAWDADQREFARRADTVRMLDRAKRESEALLALPDAVDLEAINDGISGIADSARFEPYDRTLQRSLELRTELTRRVRAGAHTPEQLGTLYTALGRVCGVLAYLTLDLGQADTARVHAQAAFTLGERANHDTLRAWARGTQALAWRFTKNFEAARDAATDGLNYVSQTTGTMESRLLCGLAASVANLGDSHRALALLDDADRARDHASADEISGLFSFSEAKQIYYRGFSLMWAEEPQLLRKSVRASEDAIRAWQAQRSPGDEMLSHIYLASAAARLGDLDASLAAVAPVLETPISAHFSWVRKRLNQLDALLAAHFPNSSAAAAARETLQAYVLAA